VNYIVDECFREAVEARSWCRSGNGYWVHGGSKKRRERCLLHQFVWQLSGRTLPVRPLSIDHINRDTSDNRLENLRIATQTLQNYNTRPRKRARHELPRGVYWMEGRDRPYAAKVCHRGRQIYCGYHATPEEASAAVDAKRTELACQESFT
jgi:hypothetical protein